MNVDKEIIKQQEDKAREFIKTLDSKRKFNPFTGEAQAEIDRLENELANQKAITELAVKGLREIVKGDESYHTTIFEARDWIDKIEVVADTTLSEIERLQNER